MNSETSVKRDGIKNPPTSPKGINFKLCFVLKPLLHNIIFDSTNIKLTELCTRKVCELSIQGLMPLPALPGATYGQSHEIFDPRFVFINQSHLGH
jgi:hypothetical protein